MKSGSKKTKTSEKSGCAVMVRPLGGAPYPVRIGPGALETLGGMVKGLSPAPRAFMVTCRSLEKNLLPTAIESLRAAGVPGDALVLPDGERTKSFVWYERVVRALAASADMRDAVVVALGGGVIGDLAGFAAATYRRGVPCVQAPTTLLAMVDSSVGGKTGIDVPEGKNLVGAFHQPAAVLADTRALRTLPARELRAGLAEAIKYGAIFDAKFFRFVAGEAQALLALEEAPLTRVIRESVRFKAQVVAADPLDRLGRRALLNFGHTFAHGIEAACGFRRFRHGEAVAVGMVCAADLSRRLGRLSAAEAAEIESGVLALGLPARVRGVDAASVLAHMGADKKFAAGKNRFVLLNRIGEAVVVSGVPVRQVRAALASRIDD